MKQLDIVLKANWRELAEKQLIKLMEDDGFRPKEIFMVLGLSKCIPYGLFIRLNIDSCYLLYNIAASNETMAEMIMNNEFAYD